MRDELIVNPGFDPTLIVVGVPTFGTVSIQWHMSMSRMQSMNVRLREMVVVGHEVGVARDYIVKRALEDVGSNGERASHVFFVDDDVLIPPDALLRLLSHDLPIVGGLYYAKTATPQPLILRDGYGGVDRAWNDGDMVECAAHGMGCTLIRRDVFEAIEPPWFVTVNDADGHTKIHSTEDVHFCRQARAAGFQPVIDTGLFCPHWDATERRWYPLDRYQREVAA